MTDQVLFVAAAYAAIWLGFFGYSFFLAKKLKSIERELELLE